MKETRRIVSRRPPSSTLIAARLLTTHDTLAAHRRQVLFEGHPQDARESRSAALARGLQEVDADLQELPRLPADARPTEATSDDIAFPTDVRVRRFKNKNDLREQEVEAARRVRRFGLLPSLLPPSLTPVH